MLAKAYTSILPDPQIRGHVTMWRDRLRKIVGEADYAAYLATKPEDPADPNASIARMRADLLSLIDRLNYLYTATPSKERMRNRISFWLSVVTLVLVALISLQLRGALRANGTHASHTLLIAVLAGVLGGFISVQQRLQGATDVDPLFKRLELSSGFWNIIVVAPLTGGVFAAVLYAIFAAGVASGAVFPTIATEGIAPTVDGHAGYVSLEAFLRDTGPASGADLAKLAVWSFVAGFAERFVPDVLTRLAGNGIGQPKAKS